MDERFNVMRFLLNLGYILFLQRRCTQAENYYKQALKLATEDKNLREISIFHEYEGELCFVTGDWKKAREHYNQALKIGEEIAPQGDIINQTCRLLAELELAQGNLEKAISFCERSLSVSLRLGDRFEEGIVYRILGKIYFFKKDTVKAKDNFEKSIKLNWRKPGIAKQIW